VVLYEFATEADENPDVIGWAPASGSVLIECKLTRSDFLAIYGLIAHTLNCVKWNLPGRISR
jgi:hypothetical protein